MKTLQVVFLLAVSLSVAQSLDYKALNQLRDMILCVKSQSWSVDDADDDSFCGKGGSGTLVDDPDRCCYVHDQCYSDAMQLPECSGFFDHPYIKFYDYSCDELNKKVTCDENNNVCEMFVCECDRKAAECFGKSHWNPDHEHLPSDQSQSKAVGALPQFRNMILCVMPDSWPIWDYADYGCYCGKGGSGTPVDDLDRCCYVHDHCYSDAMQLPECSGFFDHPFIKFYHYSCDEPNKKVTCDENNNKCQMFICECDRKAAVCFSKSPLNPDHKHLPSDRCKNSTTGSN